MGHFQVVCLLLVLVASGCASTPPDSTDKHSDSQLQEMGRRFLAARDFGQALKYLTQAESRRPNDAGIQYDLGVAYYERGMRFEAFSHLKKALELKPDYPEVENALGRYYADQDQLDLAQRSFERAIKNPFYSTPHLALFNLGLVYEKKGNPGAALMQYEEAVRLQPNYALAHFRIAQLQEEAGVPDKAREAYARVIELVPDTAEAYYRYGVLCYNAGELRNATHSLNRVIQLAPYSSMAEDAGRYLELLEAVTIVRKPIPTTPAEPRERRLQPDTIARGLQDEEAEFGFPPMVETRDENIEPEREPVTGVGALAAVPGPSITEGPRRLQVEEPEIASPAETPLPTSPAPSVEGLEPSGVTTDQDLPKEEPVTASPAAEANPSVEPQVVEKSDVVAVDSATLPSPVGNVEQVQPGAAKLCYIVHLASFRDKEDAEKLKRRLLKKGFDASVKSVNQPGMGRLYAVQLKPVDSADMANELLMQVRKVRRGKVKIIEEPAN